VQDEITSKTDIATITSRHPEAKEILKRFSIDTETEDPVATLDEICRKKDIDVDEVIDTLNDILIEDYDSMLGNEEDD